MLAVPASDNRVVLLERLSWEATTYLEGGHSGRVELITFSPNGAPRTSCVRCEPARCVLQACQRR